MNSGGSWDDTSDRIVFANTEGVFRVPVSGGSPEKILSPVPSETIYGPRILPGGDHILLTVTTAIGNDRWDRAQIVAQSVTSGERTVLVEGGSDARYVPPGHLVYAIGTSLFAVSFDASTLRVTGAPVAIEQGIRRATTPGSNTAAANFSISRSGTLAFLPDTSLARATMAFADVNGGRVERLPIEGDVAEAPRVSPTRTQVAVRNRRDNAIWIHALSGAASPRRLTLEGDGRYPTWSPDGAWIAFYWRRAAGEGLYRQRADGSAPELLKPVQFARDKPVFWSRDGQSLFYVNDSGLWSVERGGASPRARLEGLAGESSFGPDVSLSPDGSWVAFHTVEGGTTVPFIQSLSDAGRKFAISTTGGSHPLWAPDGQRIFYVAGDSRRLMAVDVALQPTVVFGQPVVVLDAVVQPQTIGRNYDITPDGTRLLVLVPEDEGNAESPLVEVVQHWTEGLKQRVPID
jgi:serine/threonine-protein kinase